MTTAERLLGSPLRPQGAAAAPPAATRRTAAAASTAALPPALQGAVVRGPWRTGLAASAAWLFLGTLTLAWPNKEIGFSDWNFTREFGVAALVIAVLLAVVALLGASSGIAGRPARALRPAGQW